MCLYLPDSQMDDKDVFKFPGYMRHGGIERERFCCRHLANMLPVAPTILTLVIPILYLCSERLTCNWNAK